MLYFQIPGFLLRYNCSVFGECFLIIFWLSLMNSDSHNKKVPGKYSVLNENMAMDC